MGEAKTLPTYSESIEIPTMLSGLPPTLYFTIFGIT